MRLEGKLLTYHADVTVFRNVESIRIYKKSKRIIVNGNLRVRQTMRSRLQFIVVITKQTRKVSDICV